VGKSNRTLNIIKRFDKAPCTKLLSLKNIQLFIAIISISITNAYFQNTESTALQLALVKILHPTGLI
jgi:hypothetical protein